ncbi:MAG TPA: TIGR03842 family LLM class F420-dependent oxidoreductase [Acidimicrobiia bacterium]|nr:TIGR03842 family LLM class F420-dependent oxidoreductase [Acidimicrobiia bacterium]
MDFGVVLQTDPPASRVVDLAKLAEQNGFSHVWTFDSHVLWQEPFVVYSQMLAATDRIVVGPMVTNPGTRDWTVLGSLFATLNDTYGPRTICGMGRGDSALRYIGRKPATLATMSESMKVIKGLVAGDSVMYKDVRLRLRWVDEHGWDLPMWVAGYGPRALDLVGREADGFILQLADPKILEWTMEAVKAAARNAGRDPDEIDFCVAAPAYVGDDLDHQRNELRWFGGMVGNHVEDLVARYGGEGSAVPRALTDFIKDRKDYDYLHHGKRRNPSADFVPDAVVDRFCVLGTAADHIAKLTQLRDMGVDQFAIYLMHDANEATMEAYGREIIPALR